MTVSVPVSVMQAITLVTNPLVNSYKRLVPGYDAPVDIAWSGSSANRSALIRIPSQKGSATQIEIRNPDATCNPYLALALCLEAGMDGIRRKLTPPEELHACPFGAIGSKTYLVPIIENILAGKEVIAMCAPSIEGQYGDNITMKKVCS